jgi:hypothetical protein
MPAPDAWTETAFINLNDGTTDSQIHSITETIDIDQGDKPIEGIATLAGGRLKKFSPQEDTTITFEGYPIGIGDKDAASQDGLDTFFNAGTDAAAPFTVTSSRSRTTFTVTIMWTNDSAATTAKSAVTSGSYAKRYVFSNCELISCKETHTDGILKATWMFKCTAFNKAGTGNITVESTDGSAGMDAL